METDPPNAEPRKPADAATRLAGERTLLAWVRTGLAMMGFGFVVARFGLFLRELAAAGNLARPPHVGFSLWIGVALVAVGVAVCLLAAGQHLAFLRRIDAGLPYRPPRWSLGVIVAFFLAITGVVMAVYLLLLGA